MYVRGSRRRQRPRRSACVNALDVTPPALSWLHETRPPWRSMVAASSSGRRIPPQWRPMALTGADLDQGVDEATDVEEAPPNPEPAPASALLRGPRCTLDGP